MPLVLNEIDRRSMSPQMFFANWSNRRNRSPARNPAILSEACSPPWRAWISSLTFQAARRTLSTVWRNSCNVAASGAGSNWNRCTSRLSSDVKRLVSADKVEGTVLMSGINLFPDIVAWSWPYWPGEKVTQVMRATYHPVQCRNRHHRKTSRRRLTQIKPLTTEDTRSTPLSQAQGRSGQATEHRGRAQSQPALGFSQCLRVSVVNGAALLQ